MTITAADMRSKLLTVDEALERLRPDDGLRTEILPRDATFFIGDSWWEGFDGMDDTQPVDACVRFPSGIEYQLTKSGVVELSTSVGLSASYISKLPGSLLRNHLAYWYSNPERQTKLFVNADNQARGVAKATISTFSNVRMVERAVGAIKSRYGQDTEVWVDKKMRHSVASTQVMLVIPEASRAIRPGDDWSGGVVIKNSLLGEHGTSMSGFLFRWWCTNGCFTTGKRSDSFRRGGGESDAGIYEWVSNTTSRILDFLDVDFDRVADLATMRIEGQVERVLNDIFERQRIPNNLRDPIRSEFMEAGDATMYGVMQAITSVANRSGLRASTRDRLMTVGGEFVTDDRSELERLRMLASAAERLRRTAEIDTDGRVIVDPDEFHRLAGTLVSDDDDSIFEEDGQ